MYVGQYWLVGTNDDAISHTWVDTLLTKDFWRDTLEGVDARLPLELGRWEKNTLTMLKPLGEKDIVVKIVDSFLVRFVLVCAGLSSVLRVSLLGVPLRRCCDVCRDWNTPADLKGLELQITTTHTMQIMQPTRCQHTFDVGCCHVTGCSFGLRQCVFLFRGCSLFMFAGYWRQLLVPRQRLQG